MLLKVVFPNGRSSIYRTLEEINFNPVGYRVLVPTKSGKGATAIVVKVLPDNGEEGILYADSFPDRHPVVNPPTIELLKNFLLEYLTTLGETLFSLVPPWADWYQETYVVAVDKDPVGVPKSVKLIFEELKKRGRVPLEKFVKKFDPKVVKLLERHNLIKVETKWVAPKVEEVFYRLKVKDREEFLKRLKRVSQTRREEALKLFNLFEYIDLPSKEDLKAEGISSATLNFLKKKGIIEKVVLNLAPFKETKLKQETFKGGYTKPPEERELFKNFPLKGRLKKVSELAEWSLSKNRDLLLVVPSYELFEFYREELFKRFGDRLVVYHHTLSQKEAIKNWFRAAESFPKIVLTTPQRAFMPVNNIGAIVLEDEFSPAYKQQRSPYLNLKRLLFEYAKLLKVPLVVFSNPPSLELHLISKTFKVEENTKDLRRVLFDERDPFKESGILELVKGSEALILVPKKGYSNLYCKRCQIFLECPRCDSLLYKDSDGLLQCPLCGYKQKETACPRCGEETADFGYGVERVKEILSSVDGKFDVLTHPKEINREYPVVAVLFSDAILSLSDFRKGEELYAYLKKAENLAAEGGLFIVHSRVPDHHAVRAVIENNGQLFYEEEKEYRKLLELPPFARLYLIALNLKEENEALAKKLFKELKTSLFNLPVEVNLSKAPTFRLRERYRYQILLKLPLKVEREILKKLSEVLKGVKNRYKFARVIPNPRSLL